MIGEIFGDVYIKSDHKITRVRNNENIPIITIFLHIFEFLREFLHTSMLTLPR